MLSSPCSKLLNKSLTIALGVKSKLALPQARAVWVLAYPLFTPPPSALCACNQAPAPSPSRPTELVLGGEDSEGTVSPDDLSRAER